MASAIVGTLKVLLEANAAKLDSEFAKATVTVGNFDKFTANAGRSLTRMVESFSGARIVAEAAKMAAAVEKVGGVGALTERELKRVQGSVDAAVDKLTRMGVAVPDSIAKVKKEIDALGVASKGTESSVGSLGKAFQTLGPLLPLTSIAGVVTGITSLVTGALDAAGKISDLSAKTGLGAETLQRMQAVANQTGTSVDAFANAALKLGVNIAEGSTKAKDAIQTLGLSYTELKQLKPEEQFAKVEAALENVASTQERNRLGIALFGKGFAEISAAVAGGYADMANAAKVSSAEQIAALDAAGDAWQKFKDDASSAVVSFLGTAIISFQDVRRAEAELTSTQQIGLFIAQLWGDGYTEALRKVGEQLRKTKEQQDSFNDAFKLMRTHTAPAVVSTTDYAQALKDANAEAAALDATQRTQLNAALKLGGDAAKEYADTIHLSEAGLRAYQAQVAAATQKQKEKEAQDKKNEAAQKAFNESIRSTISILGGIPLQPFKAAIEGVDLANLAAGFESNGTIIVNSLTESAAVTAEAEKATLAWATAHSAVLKPAVMEVRAVIQEAATDSQTWGQAITGGLSGALSRLGPTILGAIQGGGSIVQSIASLFGSGLGEGIGKNAAAALGKILPKALGDVLGAALPGVGALLGPLIDKVFGMFGPSKQVLEARKNLEALEKTLRESLTAEEKAEAGGRGWAETLIRVRRAIIAVGGSAADAEKLVARLFDTDHPEAAKKALEDVNQLLKDEAKAAEDAAKQIVDQEQAFKDAQAAAHDLVGQVEDLVASSGTLPKNLDPYIQALKDAGLITDADVEKLKGLQETAQTVNFQKMQEAIDLFHGRVESLGPAFQNQRIQQTAAQYVNAFDVMAKGGADVGGMLFDAKEELAALVQDAIKNKTTLPAQLKPYIDRLIETGQLLDEDKKKIQNVGDLKYGEPIKTEAEKAADGFNDILKKIQELIDKITGPLDKALDDVAKPRTAEINVKFNEPAVAPTGFPVPTEQLFAGSAPSLMVPTPLPTGPSAGTTATLNAGLTVPAMATGAATASVAGAPPIVVLPMLPVTDPYQAAEEAASQFRQRVGVDSHGMRESIETVVDDWLRTYYQPR